jgi:hypothetical protein
MSGPTTAILVEDPIAVLLSAAGIRAAMAVTEGYRQRAELAAQHQTEHSAVIHQQQDANRDGAKARQQQLELAESEFSHLLILSERLGVADRIKSGKPVNAEASALQSYNDQIRAILRNHSASHDAADNWDLDFGHIQISQPSDVEPDKVQRLLARISHLGSVPEQIQGLVRQLAENLPPQREELLFLELKRQIQHHLEQVQRKQVQEASALILRHTLKELGYQVEEFSDTLFVDGGVVHFRRHGWKNEGNNYMVRMRINEKTHTANFNVIRAVENASNEISVLDHLAEDRWCAEFPTLLNAMAAQGLTLNVTRRLEAGEVPVQLVAADLLPSFAGTEDETGITAVPLKARTLT